MAAALFVAVWLNFQGVRDASDALIRGHSVALQAELRSDFAELMGVPTDEELEEIFQERQAEGLRYIAVVRQHKVLASAGTTEMEAGALLGLTPGKLRMVDGRARVRIIPRRRRSPRRARRPRRALPALVIEFEPVEARALRRQAGRSLMLGAVAASFMVLVAIFLVRWFLRRDRMAARISHERRLQSLGQMSAVLAHEIRNPLASLKGNAQLLERLIPKGPEFSDKASAKARRVVTESTRLEELINDLLEFAKTGELELTSVDPAALLGSCAAKLGDQEVHLETSRAPKRWQLDSERIGQALNNLLQNAAAAGEHISAQCYERDNKLHFVIGDDGDGFDESKYENLFEPFHTTRAQGTGLGLAVAKRLVELHGGSISGHNTDEGGAEFRIEIPA